MFFGLGLWCAMIIIIFQKQQSKVLNNHYPQREQQNNFWKGSIHTRNNNQQQQIHFQFWMNLRTNVQNSYQPWPKYGQSSRILINHKNYFLYFSNQNLLIGISQQEFHFLLFLRIHCYSILKVLLMDLKMIFIHQEKRMFEYWTDGQNFMIRFTITSLEQLSVSLSLRFYFIIIRQALTRQSLKNNPFLCLIIKPQQGNAAYFQLYSQCQVQAITALILVVFRFTFVIKVVILMLAEDSSSGIYPQENISIVAVTWNLFASLPPMNSLVQLSRSPSFSPSPDLIFIGTQECERSIFLSFCCEQKSQWENMLVEVFTQYTLVATSVMRGLHSAVLIRNKLRNYFSFDNSSKLKAGTCGIMGNKGAISMQITILGQPFQLINCHLAHQQTSSQLRNQTITRILGELLKDNVNYQIFILGDFNYRIEMTKSEYQMLNISKRLNTDDEVNYYSFLEKDQLTNQSILKEHFLKRFEQGKIGFPPTYKMDIRSNEYSRERIPGWTDRIFTRKKVGKIGMNTQSYICGYNILGCDHRPVIGRYSKQIIQNAPYFNNDYQKKSNPNNESGCQLM